MNRAEDHPRPDRPTLALLLVAGVLPAQAQEPDEEPTRLETLEIRYEETESRSTTETGGSTVVLDSAELDSVAGNQNDPLAAVGTLPGVVTPGSTGNGGATGSLGAGFFIRGSNARDNQFRVDGLPVGYLFHQGGTTSILNPDTVRRFDTYLAGYPAEFGDGLGGVVDVSLREPRRDRLHQEYQVGFYEASALIEGPLGERDSGFLALRRSYIDLLLPKSGSLGDVEYTTFPQFHDGQARWRRELDDGFLEFSLFTARDETGLLFDDEAAGDDPALAGELGADQAFTTLGGRWVQQLGPSWEQRVRFGRLEERFDFAIGTQGADDPDPGEPFFLELATTTDFLRPQWQHFGDQLWTLGVDAESSEVAIDAYAPTQPSVQDPGTPLSQSRTVAADTTLRYRETAPYVEVEPAPLGNLFPRLGLRYTHQESPDGVATLSGWSPRTQWRYDLTPSTALTAQWGLYRQAPAGNERVPGAGNPDLRWTRAEHRVLGIKHNLSGPWSLQLEAYHKPMRDLVLEDRESGPPDNYTNELEGEAYGVDLLAKRNLSDGRVGWLGYSWGRSFRRDTTTGERYPFAADQPHTLQAVWSQPFHETSRWRWGARLLARSGQPYTRVVGRTEETYTDADGNDQSYWAPVYGDLNGGRLPPFVRLDLRAERSYRFGWGELTTSFSLLNVTEPLRPNVTGYDYADDYSNYEDPDEASGFPFLPSFSIRATL